MVDQISAFGYRFRWALIVRVAEEHRRLKNRPRTRVHLPTPKKTLRFAEITWHFSPLSLTLMCSDVGDASSTTSYLTGRLLTSASSMSSAAQFSEATIGINFATQTSHTCVLVVRSNCGGLGVVNVPALPLRSSGLTPQASK